MKLTDKFAATVLPTNKITYYRDDTVRGFCLKVMPSGNKIWFLYLRVYNKLLNRSIGTTKVFDVKEAREIARQWASELIRGIDTKGDIRERAAAEIRERIEQSKGISIFDAAHQYVAVIKLKPSSIKYYLKLLNSGLKPYHNVKLNTLDFDWVRVHLEIIDKRTTPLHAAKCIKFLRTLCLWKDINSPIPSRIRMATSKPRQARLDPTDGVKIMAALKAGPKTAPWLYTTVMLLTGCRTEELSMLTVDKVDLVEGFFLLPNTKNGRDHKVYLSKECSVIIQKLIKNKEPKARVFEGAKEGRVSKENLQHIGPWSNHDLRKLFAIVATEIGIPFPVIKAALNHSSNDVTLSHYAHATPSQLRNCWERIAEYYSKRSAPLATFNEPQPTQIEVTT